jgi:putative membrane protein
VGEIVGAVPAFIGLVFFVRIGAADGSASSNLLETLFILGPVTTGAVRYFTTRYAVAPHAVHLERGLVVRRKQVMPRVNIQNVSSSAGIVGRVLGLTEVKVSDASAGAEIHIRYLDTTAANELVGALRPGGSSPPTATRRGATGPAGHPPAAAPIEARALKVADNGALIRAELARMVPATLGLLAMAAIGLAAWSAGRSPGALEMTGSIGSILGVALLFAGWQAIGSFLSLSGFVLSADADGIHTRQGAFTEVRNNASRDRLQMIRVHEDLLLRAQGLERVTYDTADGRSGAASTSYLSPAGPRREWRRLVAEVMEPGAAAEPTLARVDRRTIRRTLVRWALAAPLSMPLFLVQPLGAAVVVAAWCIAGWVYAPARWRLLGYRVTEPYLFARTGVIAHKLWIVRLDKIQALTLDATFFQRRLGLASIRIGCAGRVGALVIPDLTAADARQLFELLSARSASTPIRSTI